MEYMALLMFVVVCGVLLLGYPVALSLAGTALFFSGLGIGFGVFESAFLSALPNRLFLLVLFVQPARLGRSSLPRSR